MAKNVSTKSSGSESESSPIALVEPELLERSRPVLCDLLDLTKSTTVLRLSYFET